MTNINKRWFTEECGECGTSFSLEIHEKLHEEQTLFQKIEIYLTKSFGKLMVIDGFIMLTERDNFIYHEMVTHPALYSHNNPKNVVIIGGGDCGTLCEVAKHSCITNIKQVEIDKRVTELSTEYFPNLCAANKDPRVEFIFENAIDWIQNIKSDSTDVIIIDSTDPIGPAKGLFSTTFYKQCLRALTRDGLLVHQSESPLIHVDSIIKPMQTCMLSAGFKFTNHIYFPQPSYPSGWWSATIASIHKIQFSRKMEVKQRPINTMYYNHAIHIASFATPNFLKEKLSQ